MAKILVTGGAGFIGSHVAEELIKRTPARARAQRDDLPAPAFGSRR